MRRSTLFTFSLTSELLRSLPGEHQSPRGRSQDPEVPGRPCLSSYERALSFLMGGAPLPSLAGQDLRCLRPGSLAPGPPILSDGPVDRGLLGDMSPVSRGATNELFASECCHPVGISMPVERKVVLLSSFLFLSDGE